MIRPIRSYKRISTKFGASPDPGTFGKHAGIDYAADIGTKVYMPCDGTVRMATYGSKGGYQIEVDAGGKFRRFLHLKKDSIRVKVGQKVKEGYWIASSGNTGGLSTGPHLHYDVRKRNTAYNHSFSDYIDPEKELLLANSEKPKPKVIRIKLKGTWFSRYYVRTGPGMKYPPRTRKVGKGSVTNFAHGGQKYTGIVSTDGWVKISFAGATGYVGPATYRKI